MMLSSASRYINSLCSRFIRSNDGNVAITLGIALVPIFTVVGVSIDYGRAAAARSAMQAAADATALMISKDAATLSASALKTKADAYFKALLNRTDLKGVSVGATYSTTTSSGQSVKVDASASIANDFMSMASLGNKASTAIGTSSTVRWGARYRVALALDNTGSMDDANKMTELKKAAAKMIEDFAAMAKTKDDIYISIVPFSLDVNVGNSNKAKDWLGWDYLGTCYSTLTGLADASKTDGPACRAKSNREWKTSTAQKNAWTGCVPDRDYAHVADHDLKNTLPNPANKETLFDAENYIVNFKDLCPVSMIGMTSVYDKKQVLLDKIDDMTPVGNTNQTIGLAWAWMTHTIGAGPFPAPAKDSTMEYKDVIILLTDGDNTENRWDNGGGAKAKIDTRQATLCNNIKTTVSDMEIYTVQVATGSDAVQSVLKNCATKPNDPAYFSYITNATQLSTKFKNIFESIARLRVSQ